MIHLTLEIIQGVDKGKTVTVKESESLIIGRSTTAHLTIGAGMDGLVSRNHCIVEFRAHQCILTDLNSKNGTFVNGLKVNRYVLHDKDQIRIGSILILVTLKEESPPKVKCTVCSNDVSEEVYESVDATHTPEGYVCFACQEKDPALSRLTVLPPSLSRFKRFQCSRCAVDLTSSANMDSLAYEMTESIYLCQDCAAKEKQQDYTFLNEDEYLILGEIGKGGMGIVYKAVHRRTGRICAIKRIHPSAVDDDRRLKLFEREITVQSRVLHPNLVRVLDKGLSGSTCYFITEYLPGGDVVVLMTKVLKRPLPPPLACSIIVQVLKGLAALHERGFIHRDLKPNNFLLSNPREDKSYIAKICDYGLAKSFEKSDSTVYDITKTKGGFAGSVMFMSPEIIKNYKYCKPPVDVYSVGVSLYFMLSGKYSLDFTTPAGHGKKGHFTGGDRHPVEIVLEDKPVPLLSRNARIPSSLARIVDKAVAKESNKGFQSADEFRVEIEQAMEKEGWSRPHPLPDNTPRKGDVQ